MAELVLPALFALFVVAPYGVLTLWRAPDHAARRRLIAWGCTALGLALLLLWVAPWRGDDAPTPEDRREAAEEGPADPELRS